MEMISTRSHITTQKRAINILPFLIVSLITITTLLLPAIANAGVAKDILIERYQRQLKALTNARDSLRVMYYIFDLSDRKGQAEIAWQIYDTAQRADDINAQMDMLRNLSVFYYSNDSIVNILQKWADKIPNEEARASTKTFIFNQQVSYKTRKPDDEALGNMLLDSIVYSHNLQGHDVYDRIALLFQIIQYIGVEAEGSLFLECMNKYSDLIEKLPQSDYALKNQFYTSNAIFHSRINSDQRIAVAYDKKLLDIIEQLQQMYISKNRKYRNYDTSKFICYRRMLSNFKVLSQQQIEEYHDSLMKIYDRNTDVKNMMDKHGRVHAYYHYGKGDYASAYPYIKKSLENKNLSVYERIKLYDMLMNTAKHLGDQQTYIEAMEKYIEDENTVDSMRSVATNREILLRNSLTNAPLLQNDEEIKSARNNKGRDLAYIIVTSLLAGMLLLYMYLYIKLKRKLAKH